MSRRDLYAATGTHPLSSDREIAAAARAAAKRTHPDRGGDAASFREQRALYEILTKSRREYDEALIRDSAAALISIGGQLASSPQRHVPYTPSPAGSGARAAPATAPARRENTKHRSRPAAVTLCLPSCVAGGAVGAVAWLAIHGLGRRYGEAAGAGLTFTTLAACAGALVWQLTSWRRELQAVAVALAVTVMIMAAEHHRIRDGDVINQAAAAGAASLAVGAGGQLLEIRAHRRR